MRVWQRMTLVALAMSAGMWVRAAEEPAAEAPASTASAVEPAKINLNLKDAAAEEAFDQLGRQAGLDLLVDDGGMWQRADLVNITAKDAAFWPTFIDVCRQSKVSFNAYYDQSRPRTLRLNSSDNGGAANLPSSVSGGFVVLAQSASRNYNVDYANPKSSSGQFTIQFMVLCDPALRVQQMGSATVTEAVDENGLSLRSPSQNGVSYGGNQGFIQNAGVVLNYPAGAGKKIALLKGTLRPTVVTKVEDVVIDAPLTLKTPVKKTTSEYDVAIGPLKRQGEGRQYELKIVFTPKTASKPGVRRNRNTDFWSLVSTIELSDSDGRRLSYSGGGGGGGGNSITYTVNFSAQGDQAGEPAKLAWKLPAETQEAQVAFEFKNLAVPGEK